MSVIQAGNTTTTSLIYSGDTTGNLVLTTGGANTAALTLSNTQTATFAGSVTVPAAGITFSDGSSIASHANPNVTVLTSGSGTYTTPTGAKWLQIEMAGGGGGGGGGGGNGSNLGSVLGGNGTSSTFGTSLLTAGGGTSTTSNGGGGGVGGSVTVNSPAISVYALAGQSGVGWNYNYGVATPMPGFPGAATPFGGPGMANSNSPNALPNTGSGGCGGGVNNTGGRFSGPSGPAGGYIKAIITSPSATYSYTVGTGGTGGPAADGAGSAGGAGGSGVIIVTAYF